MNTEKKLIGDTGLTEAVIKAAYAVANTLGCGFLEKIYENALAIELEHNGHKVERQKPFEVWYRGAQVGIYLADLIVDGSVVVELKASSGLESIHRAQCLNYLRASSLPLGLLINFGQPRLEVQRIQSFVH